MLLRFIAVPVAQGFWTLVAYIVTRCGFPEAGAVVFRASLASTSLGAISALAAFARTRHRLDLIAVRQRLVQRAHRLRTVAQQRRGIYTPSWNAFGWTSASRHPACRRRGRIRIR